MKKKKKRARRFMESRQTNQTAASVNENAAQTESEAQTNKSNTGEIPIEDKPIENTNAEKVEVVDGDMPTQEEWAQALKKTVEERDSYKDSYLRSQAEFQNFKRRNALARAEAYEDGVRETISAALPAIDNLELALKHAEGSTDNDALTQGVKMTLKLLTESLGKLGLEEVPALGEQFDPDRHNAVMREPGGEENVISEVFQKGYKVHDKMIRYAMVKVYSGADA